MSVFNFFRNFFGRRDREEPKHERLDDPESKRHSFRNPIWQNDDEENDDDDFRHFGDGMHFSIFSDPMEITRYFESQMDDILKSFFSGSDYGPSFSIPGNDLMPQLPFAEPKQKDLRSQMLKPGYDMPESHNYGKSKTDADLDGKISAGDLSKIWEEPERKNQQIVPNHFYHTSRFVTKRTVVGPDGTIEHQQIIRDGEGNEEKTVTKQIGDKKYVVTTKRDRNGIESKTEDLINIDESEMNNFEQKWVSPFGNNDSPNINIFNNFPWEKLFGPNPKL